MNLNQFLKCENASNMGLCVKASWRESSAILKDYLQTRGYKNRMKDSRDLTYGGLPGLTESITANIFHRLMWMITQILACLLS